MGWFWRFNGMTNTVFDTKKHSNVKRRAEYRRVRKYYKSLEKFKAEKHRRKQALELQDKGLTIKQIALKLQVSQRTIKRDLATMMIYVKKQRTQLLHQNLEKFQAMSLKEQIKYVKNLHELQRRIYKSRRCSSLVVTIDLEAALSGNYAMDFKPKLPVDMLENGKITIQLTAHGKKQAISRIYVGKVTWGTANLDTNQSLHGVTAFSLKGLKIIETADNTNQ
jgi:hypothetical protein